MERKEKEENKGKYGAQSAHPLLLLRTTTSSQPSERGPSSRNSEKPVRINRMWTKNSYSYSGDGAVGAGREPLEHQGLPGPLWSWGSPVEALKIRWSALECAEGRCNALGVWQGVAVPPGPAVTGCVASRLANLGMID